MQVMKRFFLILFFPLFFFGATSTWNTTTNNAVWNSAGNWSGGVPGTGDVAEFSDVITAPTTVSVNIAVTIQGLTFNSSQPYTLTPNTGSFTFDNSTPAPLNVENTNGNGAHTVSVGITIPAGGLQVAQKSSGSFTLSGDLAGAGLTKTESGTLVLSGTNSNSAMTLSAGTIQIAQDRGLGATTATLALSGGTLETTNTLTLHASRTITLTNAPTLNTGSHTVTAEGDITGAGSLTKTGSGTLSITGTTIDYSGGTNLNAGTVSVAAESKLGSGDLTFNGGTLQVTATTSGTKQITLTGNGSLDPQANTLTWTGKITGAGSLTKLSAGTLILSNTNNDYSGGTVVSAGTLSIGSDSVLGNTAGGISLGAATLTTTATMTSARSISLTGGATITPGAGTTLTLSGNISGSGSLTKTGTTELILSGTNSYTGGTTLSAGTLTGNSSSLTGNISNSGTLAFSQSSSGTYAGALSGAGTLEKSGSGALTMTGTSTSYTGATTISGGSLIVDGSLANSAITVSNSTLLGGSGTVGNVTCNGGTISPGSSIGTLTINGTLTLDGASTVAIEISPTSADQIVITSTATLDGAVTMTGESGFYGLNRSYTILTTGAPPLVGTFASVSASDANFVPSLAYTTSSVILNVSIINPFFNFPFTSGNAEQVGNNIDQLASAGFLQQDLDLVQVIDSLVGASFADINAALDQMHPAQIGAVAEMQTVVGEEIVSLFQRQQPLICGCSETNQIWIEPFGSWLQQKAQGEQKGFHTKTQGLALGMDREVLDDWIVGLGGVLQDSHISWHEERGFLDMRGVYGAVYSNFFKENFQMGVSAVGGKGWYDNTRKIQFTTIDRHADASFDGVEFLGRLSLAYFFGAPVCHFYPFANVDFYYLRLDEFEERRAQSLNLHVDSYTSVTMRNEAGFGIEVIDKNYEETICISPLVTLSWAMEVPLIRDPFKARFQNEPIFFNTKGWDETWNLISARFGLKITYHCFSLSGEYALEASVDEGDPYKNQRANLQFAWNW